MKDSKEIRMIKMLEAKEKRYYKIKKIIDDDKNPVISFMLNIPGKEKNFKEAVCFHIHKIEEIKKILKENKIEIKNEIYENLDTGMEYIVEFIGDANFVKKLMVEFEEKKEENRILDIDIYDENFKQISRKSLGLSERRCFICKDKARVCIKEERHSLEDLEKSVKEMLGIRNMQS